MSPVHSVCHELLLGRFRAGLSVLLLATVMVALISPLAWADVQSRFPNVGAGNWSQNSPATGPPDPDCVNMGNIDTTQSLRDFRFAIPDGDEVDDAGDATIQGIIVRIKAVAQNRDVQIQLLGPAGTPIGTPKDVEITNGPPNNCSDTTYTNHVFGSDSDLWDTSLTSHQINSANFGVQFTKKETGTVKVDAVCIDVFFEGDADEISSCTSTSNTGSITIEKETTGSFDDSFDFEIDDSDGTPVATTTVATSGESGSSLPIDLSPDLYSVSEMIPSGWDLTSASCDDGTSSFDGTDTINDINLNPGDEITCTFGDSPEPGDITVVKEVVGDPPQTGSWEFDWTSGSFSIPASGGAQSFSSEPGSITITEEAQGGYDTAVTCDTGDEGLNEVTFTLEPGGDVTCTFVNTEQAAEVGAILVIKDVVGPAPGSEWQFGGSFSFSIDAAGGSNLISGLSPGDYTITETTQAGYEVEAGCDGAAAATNSVTASVTAGQTTTCTFTNTAQSGSITVIKSVIGAAAPEDWQFTATGGIGAFELPASGGNIQFSSLDAGDYSITEAPQVDFTTTVSCTNGESGVNSVDFALAPGENVTCTFTNEGQGELCAIDVVKFPSLTEIGLLLLALTLLVAMSWSAVRRERRIFGA